MPDRHTVEEVRADQVRKGDDVCNYGIVAESRRAQIAGADLWWLSFAGNEKRVLEIPANTPVLRRCPPVSEEDFTEDELAVLRVALADYHESDSYIFGHAGRKLLVASLERRLAAAHTTEGRR